MLLMTVIMLSQIFFSSSMSFGAQLVGDINNDSVVNMQDVLIIAKAFNTTKGQPYYDLTCDLNNDGMINMGDILKLAVNFNKSSDDYPTSDDQPANVTYEYDGVDGEYIYCNNPEGINNTTHYLADHGEVIYKTKTHGKRYATVFMQHLGGEGVGRLKFGVLLTNSNPGSVNIRISNQMFGGMKQLNPNNTPTTTVDYQNITRTNDYRKYFGGTINNPIDVYGDVIDGKLDTKIKSGYNGTTDITIPSSKSIWLMGGPSTVEEFFNEGKMEMGFVNGMAKFEKLTNLELDVKVVAYTSSNINAVKTAEKYPGWTW
ncbi:MAG TPA: dockerin type I domain-containing protein [Pseudobacteroides sp.]|uniref:dockerin type I domain-containing protein n=1 Tax=Pseudobacteroides sp. TaxID=1968840 RepID=UPI002F95B421